MLPGGQDQGRGGALCHDEGPQAGLAQQPLHLYHELLPISGVRTCTPAVAAGQATAVFASTTLDRGSATATVLSWKSLNEETPNEPTYQKLLNDHCSCNPYFMGVQNKGVQTEVAGAMIWLFECTKSWTKGSNGQGGGGGPPGYFQSAL